MNAPRPGWLRGSETRAVSETDVLGETRGMVEGECGWEWWLRSRLFVCRQHNGDGSDDNTRRVRDDATGAKDACAAGVALVGRGP